MKTIVLPVVLSLLSTGFALALPLPPFPDPSQPPGSPPSHNLDTLRLRLATDRGVSGRPIPSISPTLTTDPRAITLGRAISNATTLRRLIPAQPPTQPQPQAAPDPAAPRHNALRRLSQTASPDLQVHLRHENGTLRQARASRLAPATQGPTLASPQERLLATTTTFLHNHAALLGLDDPTAELTLERSEPNGLGGRHLRFSQRLGNLPVWPATLSAHLDPAGNLTLLEGAYIPTPRHLQAQQPTVPAPDAILRARASIPAGMRADASIPELIIHAPLDATPRLAWRFNLNLGFTQAWTFVVDALDARILRRSNRILDAAVPGRGTDLQGTTRNLSVWQANGTHFLIDASKPMFKPGSDPVQQPQGAITIADARNKPINDLKGSDVFLITSPNPNQWDVPDGVSAAFNYSQTYDYFLARHDRNSLDGNGGNITAVVRVGDYDNASWNGNLRLMLFGTVQPYAGALDVVGHELTHGLTEDSANLVYENQPGALNESFSDIFGELVESYVEGQPDWKMGTRLTRVFRDFKNPGSLTIGGLNRPYPSKMSEFVQLPNTNEGDHGGVHINSSIINHGFWLLAEGLPGAIGLRDAERIFFRTLTQHLQAQSQFVDARLGAIAAAEALFGPGSSQATKTAEAFDTIEIFAAPQTPPPPPTPVVSGPDSTLFIAAQPFFGDLVLYRQESAQGDSPNGADFAYGIGLSRPAVTGDGQLALFVGDDNDLCLAETANPASRECLEVPGLVHSVAVSPNGAVGAFVFRDPATGQPDNRISLINLADGSSQSVELLAPVIDGVPIDGILYADSMTFSTDSSVLYYDALSRLRFGSGPTVERWSIYALHLDTGKISIVVPPFEGIDTGNPSMGRAGNRYLAFDARFAATGNSSIITLDLFSGNAAEVGVVQAGLGYPTFAGDESAVIHAQRDPSAFGSGFSLVRQGLGSDRLSLSGPFSLWIHDAGLGVIYRRGSFAGSNAVPQAIITSPAPNSRFTPGSPVTLSVQASDTDGTITRVDFYDGDDKLGEDTTPPFALTWTPTRDGNHRLLARATDNLGAAGDTQAVTITIGDVTPPPAPSLDITTRPDRSMRLTLRGTPGSYIISQSTDLRAWSDIYPVTIDASGSASIDDSGGPANHPTLFYRARRE